MGGPGGLALLLPVLPYSRPATPLLLVGMMLLISPSFFRRGNPQVRLQGPQSQRVCWWVRFPMKEADHFPRTPCAALSPPQAWKTNNRQKEANENKNTERRY